MHVPALCIAGILLVTRVEASATHDDISYLPTTAVEGLGETSVNYSDDGYFISPMTQIEQDSAVTTPITSTADESELTTNFALNEVDVKSTVQEVQAILAANPALPSLSTHEILDILYNITGGPSDKTSSEGHKSREDYRRALMVVLPFNANNLSDTSIQELYTKRPITRIIANKTDASLASTNTATNYGSQSSKKPIRLSPEVDKLKENQSEQEQYTSENMPTKLFSSKYQPSQGKEQLRPFDTEVQAPNHRYSTAEEIERTTTIKPVQQYPSGNGQYFAHYHETDRPSTQKYSEPTQATPTHKPNTSPSGEPNKVSFDAINKPNQQQQSHFHAVATTTSPSHEPNKVSFDAINKPNQQQQSHFHAVATTPKHPHDGQKISNQYHNQHYLLSANSGQQNYQHQNPHAILTAPTKQSQQHQPSKRRRRPQIPNRPAPFKASINNIPTRIPPAGSAYTTQAVSDHHTMSSTITSPTFQSITNYISTRMPTIPSTYINVAPTRQSIAHHATKYSVLNSNLQATQTKITETLRNSTTASSVSINKGHHSETNSERQTQSPVTSNSDKNTRFQFSGNNNTQLSNSFQNTLQNFRANTTNSSYTADNQQQLDINVNLPSDMRDILASMSVDRPVHHNGHPRPSVLFITPSPSSQIELQNTDIVGNLPNSATTNTNMDEKVREVLAAIGLFPANDVPNSTAHQATIATTAKTSTSPDASVAAESLSQEMKELLMSLGLLPSPNEEKHNEPIHASTTETSLPPYNPEPTVNPSSYLSFKPLPIPRGSSVNMQDDIMNSDMKQFLASFGLVPMSETGREAPKNTGSSFPYHGVPRARSQKALDSDAEESSLNETIYNKTMNESSLTNTLPAINTEIMSDDMMDVLENLGLVPPQTKKSDEKKKSYKKVNKNIFKPSTHFAMLNHTKEETQRLNKLLDIIKHLTKENGTLTPEEIQDLNTTFSIPLMSVPSTFSSQKYNRLEIDGDGEKTMTLDQIEDAPDPLFLEELFPTDDKRNEVKRQQENSTETDSSMSTNETSSSSSSSSSSSNATGPSLADLADSFGGGETAPANADVSKDLPTPKPNGLYFLLDWHSFLEVGEDDKGKVNLRFEPQIGNSRNFLPVNVP